MRSDAFIRGLMGPFGSGKSSGCVWDLVTRAVRQKPGPDGVRRTRWVAVRNSYRQLADTTIKTVHQWFPPYQFGEWRPSEDRYVIRAIRAADDEPGAEVEILFRALDRPDQVGNLLSLELTGAWVNEAREVPWAIIDALQGRVGRFPAQRDGGPTWFGVTLDTNPPDVDSAWFRFFEEADHSEAVEALRTAMPGWKGEFATLFKQPSGLSPTAENVANLPPGYYPRLCVGKTREWVKVYVEGEYGFTLDGKPVFPEYDDDLHCGECQTVPGAPVYRSWDFGLTPACVFSQVAPSGQWIVVDEMCATDLGIDRFSDDVLEHSARYFPGTAFVDIGDPAGAQRAQTDERTCFQILHGKGILIEPGLQTLALRLESIRRPLTRLVGKGKPGFRLHPRCTKLRRGFMGGYQFRRMQVSGERYTDAPDKNEFSHPMDALSYAATRLFGPALRGLAPVEDAPPDRGEDRTRSLVTGY